MGQTRLIPVASLVMLLIVGGGFFIRAEPQLARSIGREIESLFETRSRCQDSPSTSLKTLSSAQADFRANDRDKDGVNQFWRGDVAGLYAILPRDASAEIPNWKESQALKLIERSVALADDRPVTDIARYGVRTAKNGYWYRSIRHPDEDPQALDPQRFAYCAFPSNPGAGKYFFIVDENNTIFRTVADGRRGIEVFPTEEELRTSWAKLD